MLAHFVTKNLSLLLTPAGRVVWLPRRVLLLLLGSAAYLACDIGPAGLYCPAGSMAERSCVAHILATAYLDLCAALIQLILLLLVAGVQDNLLEKIRYLGASEDGRITPEEFKEIIRHYRNIQECTSKYVPDSQQMLQS
jgi:hypothetical protein